MRAEGKSNSRAGAAKHYENRGSPSAQNQGGAESGAVRDKTPHIDVELAKVIEAWPRLPDAIKRAILAMVNACSSDDE